jgi:type II secretion system protein G
MNLKLKGFTMMEMIIVVAVIGLLVGIVLPNISSIRNRSANEKLVAELGLVEQALYKYKESCGMFPKDSPTVGKLNTAAKNMPNNGVCSASLKDFLPASMQTSITE